MNALRFSMRSKGMPSGVESARTLKLSAFGSPPTENEREAQAMLTHRRMVARARRKEAVTTLWAQLTRLWHVAALRT